jgi:hypothetical protein
MNFKNTMKSAFCEYMNENVEGFTESVVNVFENRTKKLPLKERKGIKEQIKKNFSLFFNEDEWKDQSENMSDSESESDSSECDFESDSEVSASDSDESESESNDFDSESEDESDESETDSDSEEEDSEIDFSDSEDDESSDYDSDESESEEEESRSTKKIKTIKKKSDDEKFDFTWFEDHKPTPHTNTKVWGKKYIKKLNSRVLFHSVNRVAFTKNKDSELIFIGIVQKNKKLLRYSSNRFPRYVIKWVRDCKIIVPSKH